MQPVPRIFVSATSRDLRTARGLVSEGLRRMECLPIVQDDFPPDYKSVRDMLRTKIKDCNAVVHLAGFYYGAEPQPVLPGPDRRSFTQMEYEIAVELKLPCYVFLCGKDFPFDEHEPEPADKQHLQIAHRERLLQRDELFYEFASPEELAKRTRELQLSVEGLRKELAKERNRRRLAMGAAIAALLIAVVGGLWLSKRQGVQEAVNVAQSSEIASLKAQLEGPWAIVNKVNAAVELLKQRMKGQSDEDIRKAAIMIVAVEVKKTPEEVQKLVDQATVLAEQLLAAARTEQGTAEEKVANRALEAETLMKLGASQEAANNFKDALDSYQKATAILDPKVQPVEWMEAVTAVANMQANLGKSADAIAKYKEAIAFGESDPALGLAHEDTVYAFSNLIYHLRYTTPDLAAAETLLRGTLKKRQSKLGPEAPETLRAMGELSEVLATEKKFDEAMELAAAAEKAADRIFGPEDEVTIDIVNNLSNIYDEKGDLPKAIKLNRRVVAFQDYSLGEKDEYALSGKFILANMLERNEELDEALELYTSIYEIRTEELGAENADTIAAREAMSDVLASQEEYEKSEKILHEVIPLREKVLGKDDATTLVALDSLARLRWNQDDLPGAEKIFRGIVATNERVHGKDGPETIASVEALAELLNAEENFSEAEPLFRRVLKGHEAKLPANDPLIASTCYQLALALQGLEKKKDALAMAERAVEVGKETLKPDDDTLLTYEELAKSLSE